MNIIDLIYPKKCLECGKDGVYICNNCLSEVGKPQLLCLMCRRPSKDGMTHMKCREKMAVDYAYSPWNYTGVVRKAILKLKYNFAYDIANELSNRFVEKLKKDTDILPKKAIICPIPLHRIRQNWRGFNQSEVLAKRVSKDLGWQFYPDILLRKKLTKPQTELKGGERKENIKGAFEFNSRYLLSKTHTPIILFDDVLTTGSTIREAAMVLKRNYFKIVWGLTIAS
jgi:ComF family protein